MREGGISKGDVVIVYSLRTCRFTEYSFHTCTRPSLRKRSILSYYGRSVLYLPVRPSVLRKADHLHASRRRSPSLNRRDGSSPQILIQVAAAAVQTGVGIPSIQHPILRRMPALSLLGWRIAYLKEENGPADHLPSSQSPAVCFEGFATD